MKKISRREVIEFVKSNRNLDKPLKFAVIADQLNELGSTSMKGHRWDANILGSFYYGAISQQPRGTRRSKEQQPIKRVKSETPELVRIIAQSSALDNATKLKLITEIIGV